MPVWHKVTFEAPENMTEEQAIEFFETQKQSGERIYMNGEECEWSRVDDGFWGDIIERKDYEIEEIINQTTDEQL